MNVEVPNPTVTISPTQIPAMIPVPFYGYTLFLVEHNGEPYVPMRPIVESMGMAWQVQHRKIVASQRFCVTEMVTQMPGDDQSRAVICIPLRKLSGWLAGIYPNKVSPAIRNKVITYQNECDDVLYNYWTRGIAINPRFNPADEAEDSPVLTPEGLEVILLSSNFLANFLGDRSVPLIESSHVAYLFDRPHYPLMRRIRSLPIMSLSAGRYFDEDIYRSRNGRDLWHFKMTRDGFTMLTSNWRHRRDNGIREAIYRAFDIAEKKRQTRKQQLPTSGTMRLLANGGAS